MIKYIKVSGFKTLSDFEMELRPSLNILVGPNGAGKTNIISFFEFLGFLQNMTLTDAISSAGGAGSVFRKVGENKYENSITANIVGTIRLGYEKFLFYSYNFQIEIQESGESLIYSKQRLKLKLRTVDSINESRIDSFDLDIERRTDNNLKTSAKVRKCSESFFKQLPFFEKDISRSDAVKRIEHTLEIYSNPDESIFRSLRGIYSEYYRYLYSDIGGGQIYNIEPSKAKIPDDIAKKPGLTKDGSGLYATLYAIKRSKDAKTNRMRPSIFIFRNNAFSIHNPEIGIIKLDDILKYTQLANEYISQIEVINNAFDKQLQVRVFVLGSNTTTILPLSAMSDGTVKWICLITIFLTNRTVFSIEEPENYLHPHMLNELMSIMHSQIFPERFILMSTHSETLLNYATPEEIIVVSYVEGKTTAKRISNADNLSQEIKRTGFGLGYYYIAGSYEND